MAAAFVAGSAAGYAIAVPVGVIAVLSRMCPGGTGRFTSRHHEWRAAAAGREP
jgi:hypothetical protein